MTSMYWQNARQIECALEECFNEILFYRMHDMPVINPVLKVQALGFTNYHEDWLGLLITPWFMNLLLFPGRLNEWPALQPGGKFERYFPYGSFEFTMANEARLGQYALCSLFSPMFQFSEQADAVHAAQAALQGLLARPEPRLISRRDMLRGKLAKV